MCGDFCVHSARELFIISTASSNVERSSRIKDALLGIRIPKKTGELVARMYALRKVPVAQGYIAHPAHVLFLAKRRDKDR